VKTPRTSQLGYRSGRNAVRICALNSSVCSHAAKCPPFSSVLPDGTPFDATEGAGGAGRLTRMAKADVGLNLRATSAAAAGTFLRPFSTQRPRSAAHYQQPGAVGLENKKEALAVGKRGPKLGRNGAKPSLRQTFLFELLQFGR